MPLSALAIIVLPIVVFGTVALLVLALTAPSETPTQARLKAYGYRLGQPDLSSPFSERVLLPVVIRLASLARRFSPREAEDRIRQRLVQAGHPSGLDVNSFLAIKAAGLLALGALSLVNVLFGHGQIGMRNVILTFALSFLGWRLPEFWLSQKLDGRRKAIERALPDALDLIVVCVEAGNALEAALATVVENVRNPLTAEFDRALREVALGKPRRDAFRDLSQRAGVADLQAFIAAILQADQLGISISQVLRVQADAMRVRRRQRAEEKAAQAPVKMLMPLVGLIFPSLLLVVLGPVALRAVYFFGHQNPFH